MSSFLLGLWIVLIGADRIDFLGGHGSVILTPFLALTPLVLAGEGIRRWMLRRPLAFAPAAPLYVLTSLILLCAAFLSVFVASEPTMSASRVALLAAQVGGTFLVAVLASDRPNLITLFARAAIVAFVLYVPFNVAESLWWIGRGPESFHIGPAIAHFDNLQNAGFLPRLAGPVADANRAGFLLLFYAFAIVKSRLSSRTKSVALTAAIVLLIATLSRSAAIGAFAMFVFMLFSGMRISLRFAAAAMVALAIIPGVLLVRPQIVDRFAALQGTPIVNRLTANEGSAKSHVALIGRGIDAGLESVPRAALGLGYGNSYKVLQDFFPNNKYGNFHSLYVTMFAEAGVVALLAVLVLTFAPVIAGSPWRPLVAGAIAFNLFYQTPTEPAFWLLLALAWFAMPVRGFVERPAASTA